MPVFFGMEDRKVDLGASLYAENSRDAAITTEGIRDGLRVVWDVFERNGVLDELQMSTFMRKK